MLELCRTYGTIVKVKKFRSFLGGRNISSSILDMADISDDLMA